MTERTLIADDKPVTVSVIDDSHGLWLQAAEAHRVSGWEITPEGACQGARCVPLPEGAIRDDAVDLAALARHLGQPVLHDAKHGVWLIGAAADDLRDRMLSLEAPDFTLPDLDGRLHSLSDYRGQKVFLVTWASW
jgi:hypothetical protein